MRDLTKEIKPPKKSNKLLWIIVCLLSALLVWSYLTQFSRVVRANGKVVSHERTQIVQNLEGGILTQLNVSEGDNIEAGQVLAELDTTRYQAQLEEIEKKIATFTLRKLRLQAESENAIIFDIPKGYQDTYPDLVEAEKSLLSRKVEEYLTRERNYESQISLKQKELTNLTRFENSGAVPKRDIIALQQALNNIRAEQENYFSDTHKKRAQELSEAVSQLALANESIKTVQDQIDRATIVSPSSGTVNLIHFNTIGSVVNPGQTILEIVPNNGNLLVEARVTPKDIGYVVPGMRASLKLTAYDYSIYGTMLGKVVKIGADTVPNKEERNAPPSYVVSLEISPDSLKQWQKKGLDIRTGMLVEAELEAGHMRIIDYIFRPILKARDALATI
ncbi:MULTISPECIES: HlyD family efflux transporter periplasmic adaptor subunit [Mannheimia]|uniref:HlyD family efflux transporter periplasmic adaptor subunit n=1 Tax=Mannheimia pernigra TaxID=111844 RepID=A0A7H8USJ0_9PAST|nr:MULTISPECIES: HlyD family efflux transporter periplasmic adaptor subunit [Mannheimia]QLB39534.1 HlyD family efflux transporter periplasmic adaptor subunit [Mannheimia pernigra]QLB41496.1 HlyD family efflux transporter periplasmic adaptor subunit [Mannheimia pernigra]QLB43413.1 HlyD family efflux transporter periplasmic adaptor subunit [Mannheimia pernigra]QTM01264.1 HlyD family efflux transporter periplasmic adaptor subunit [Mannheimia sp. ZY171111]